MSIISVTGRGRTQRRGNGRRLENHTSCTLFLSKIMGISGVRKVHAERMNARRKYRWLYAAFIANRLERRNLSNGCRAIDTSVAPPTVIRTGTHLLTASGIVDSPQPGQSNCKSRFELQPSSCELVGAMPVSSAAHDRRVAAILEALAIRGHSQPLNSSSGRTGTGASGTAGASS